MKEQNIKVVSVQFQNSTNIYCYKTDLQLEKNQFVVVDSTNNIGIAKVHNPDVKDKDMIRLAIRWVLLMIDIKGARQRINGEK